MLILNKRKYGLFKIGKDASIQHATFEGNNALASNLIINNSSIGLFSYIGSNSIFYYTKIGRFCSIADNVCVIGAHIGKHCVIGANSVVTRDISDYCVAVGAPAIIIKRYDFNEKKWQKVDVHKAHGGVDIPYQESELLFVA